MKTAVIYARYSSNSQTEQSIEGQLHVCQQYAKDNDLHIVDTYIDRAMTGTNDNRAAFQQMLSDSERNATWEIVLIYAIDRFGRNSVEIAVNKQRLQKNGKTLISATQRTSVNIDGTKNLDGILLENVYIGIAEYYSAELSQKILRGQNENRKKGLFCGGHIAYGYRADNRKLYIVEEEAEVVRYIYAQYALGVYVSKIIENLTAQGILHNGKAFSNNAVYGILRNEKYIGIYNFKGEIYDNIYPQIVQPEIFDKVRKKIEANKTGTRSVKAVYLLRQKARCGYCGKPISAECGTSRGGKKVHYYKCQGKKKYRSDCPKTSIRKEALENFILDNIVEQLSKPEIMDGLIFGLMKAQEEMLRENPMLSVLRKEQKQIETALNNIMSAIEQGIISQTTNKRLHELETRQSELEREILVEQSKTIICLNETEIKTFYEKALRLEAQMLIGTLVKEIIVYNDKIEIYFNTPIRTSPDENRGFSFYSKTHEMPVVIENRKTPMILEMVLEMYA